MADDAFRITTVPTRDLCVRLDCEPNTESLDGALADAGYVRLDHGLAPTTHTAITPCDPPAGLDPGHRAQAIALATNLFHIVHADGRPEPERLRYAAQIALETIDTDPIGEYIVGALAAYAVAKDPGMRDFVVDDPFAAAPAALARSAYEVARNRNVVTDVALERAASIGSGIPGWNELLMRNIRVEEPVVRVRRHDASDYEALGIEPPLAELMAWIRANPDVEVPDFISYAGFVGIDPREAGVRIENALSGVQSITDARSAGADDVGPQTNDSGGPSSST